MRLLEILLLLSNFVLLFSIFVFKRFSKKTLLIGNLVSLLILILHFVVEGFRWQLLLSYALVIAFFAVSLYRYIKGKNGGKQKQKVLKVIAVSLAVVLIIVSAGLSYLLPVFRLPVPTGSYSVGTQTFCFEDRDRDEIFTEDKSDKRKLMVQVWYPAQNINGKKLSSYIPGSKEMLIALTKKEYPVPEILLDYLKYVKSNSYEEAEISSSSKSYPMILLNHGLGMNGYNHTSLAENLASEGYIVVAIDFTYSTSATIFPDGKTTYYDAPANTTELKNDLMKVWTEDIEFVINQFEKINSGDITSIFKGKIDFENLGICGHSFGGGASFLVSNSDPRIKAGVNMDGSLYRFENMTISDISTKPFLTMLNEQQWSIRSTVLNPNPTDEELENLNTTREQYEEGLKKWGLENDLVKQTVKNGGYEIYIKNTEHYNFTDFQMLSPLPHLVGIPGLIGKIDGERGNYIVNQYVIDFFNKYLKNKGGELLQGPNEEYPEVYFEYFK